MQSRKFATCAVVVDQKPAEAQETSAQSRQAGNALPESFSPSELPRPELLEQLLDDDFLRRAPPKSTGRERYGAAEAEALAAEWSADGRAPDDLLATLVAFTVEAVRRAADAWLGGAGGVQRVLVGGGGARNTAFMEGLARAFGAAAVEPFDAAGVPADAAEALAFALMGRNALLGLPNHLPACTGASRAAVLGEIAPARA